MMVLNKQIRKFAGAYATLLRSGPVLQLLQIADDVARLETELLRRGICEWELDEDADVWMTSCSNHWVFTSDGPKENDCHYCMYCGGVLEVVE
jgi:hypothetical protein